MSSGHPGVRAGWVRVSGAEVGAVMGLASMSSVQLGQALAVPLFDHLGAVGTGGLRLACAGVLMLALARPHLREFTGRDLLACFALGAVTAALMLVFVLAVARLPLGTASALEFLGPLGVSLYGPGGGRKYWAGSAAIGVVLLTQPWQGNTDLIGVVFAVAAASCWAAYILLTQHVGDRVTGLNGLAVSLPVAGVLGGFAAAPAEVHRMTWLLLLATLGLGALGIVAPFILEFLALRRLTASAFGTLMSVEPAIALIMGLVVLNQQPGLLPAAGVVFVVAAGVGATRTGARAATDPTALPVNAPPAPAAAPATEGQS